MTDMSVVYTDQWGDIIDREQDDCLEIRWFDTTSAMAGDDFNAFLSHFAEQVAARGRASALVDAVQFKMDMAKMNVGWRDEHIIPRYNAAGLKKFAFIVPQGMPAVGAAPANEGPANFPTGYFAARADALVWLKA